MHLLKDADLRNKTVLLRLDLDVPLVGGKVEDESRLLAGIPTIEFLLKNNAAIIIAGHLGRPEGANYEVRRKNQGLSLLPVAKWFVKQFSISNLQFARKGEFEGWEIGTKIFLLENLRFYPEEEKNDQDFSKRLAALADIYVNDAFAMSHRDHASVVGVARLLPRFAGLHLEEEVTALSKVLSNPARPLVVVIGGAKLETKLPLVEKMHHAADYVLVGGKLVEDTKTLLKMQHQRINLKPGERKSVLLTADLTADESDITSNSVQNFLQIITLAKTVIWNGPLGKISKDTTKMAKSEEGSLKLAEGLVKSSAYTIVGGGDTVGFLEKACLLDHFACMSKSRCFLSTGGGAMLSLLSGEKLPGIQALT